MNFHVTKFFSRLKVRKYFDKTLVEVQLICWNYLYATRFRGGSKTQNTLLAIKNLIFMNISLPVPRSGGAAGSAAGRSTCWLWGPLPAWRGGATARGGRGASQGSGGKGGNRPPGALQESRASSAHLSPVLRHLFQGKISSKIELSSRARITPGLTFT